MKKITLSAFLTCITVFVSTAQTSKELLANSAKDKGYYRNRIVDATFTPVNPDEAILTAKILQTCYLDSKAYLPGQTMPERIKLRRVSASMQDHRPDVVSGNLIRE